MAKKDERPPVPGGYPDTKIDGPAVERTGLHAAEPEAAPEPETAAEAEPEKDA